MFFFFNLNCVTKCQKTSKVKRTIVVLGYGVTVCDEVNDQTMTVSIPDLRAKLEFPNITLRAEVICT